VSNQIVKYPFKIHALETVEQRLPCTNGTYYATGEEALERCHRYLQAGQNTVGFVIFKAHLVVRPEAHPIRTNRVNEDGSLGETRTVDEDSFSFLPDGR